MTPAQPPPPPPPDFDDDDSKRLLRIAATEYERARALRLPIDERVRDLEVLNDVRYKEIEAMSEDVEAIDGRLKAIEAWPGKFLVIAIGISITLMTTIIGATWSVSGRLSTMEATMTGMDGRLGRMEDRTWSTHTAGGR